MKHLSKSALGLALGAALAAPAFAGGYAEPVVEAPVAAPVVAAAPNGDWTGGWIGGQVGFGDASAGALDGDGAIYGLRGGYDWDFGQWVLGAGLDWDKADIDLGTAGDNLDSIARLGLRAGDDMGRTLVCVRGGVAPAKADLGGGSRADTAGCPAPALTGTGRTSTSARRATTSTASPGSASGRGMTWAGRWSMCAAAWRRPRPISAGSAVTTPAGSRVSAPSMR